MTRNKTLLLITLLLGIIAIWVIIKQNSSTLKTEMKDFAVTDTSHITRIIITSKSGESASLERVAAGEWTINSEYKARNDAMNNLMEAICKIQVRNPVGKRAVDNVTKGLATGGSKVDIYLNGELYKVYYIGGQTQDGEGTYMLMHDHVNGVNAEAPFVVQIPGFVGYLTPRYFTDALLWREKTLFHYSASTLKKVEVKYFRAPDSSFSVSLENGKEVKVYNRTGNEISGIDSNRTRQYLSYFSSINYEGVERMDARKKDSLLHNTPIHQITATDQDGKITTLLTYPKKPATKDDDLVIKGKVFTEDPDRMWAVVNNNKEELILVQFYVIGKLLQSPGYFTKHSGPVKK